MLSPTGTKKGTYKAAKQVEGEVFIAMPYGGPRPTTWQENPRFAADVASGLPWDSSVGHWGAHTGPLEPFEQRIPIEADRLIVDVYDDIGEYGGVWRIAMSGWVLDMGQLDQSKCTHETEDDYKAVPDVCKSSSISDDGRKFFSTLRDGVMWSDATELTMEHVRRAYDIGTNPEKSTLGARWRDNVTGNLMTNEYVDDKTWAVVWDSPRWNHGEYFTENAYCRGFCVFQPKYDEQFVPGLADPVKLQALMDELDMDDWSSHYMTRISMHEERHRLRPTLGRYIRVSGTSGGAGIRMEANPFSFYFDPEGNQLPYHDEFNSIGYESRDVAVFRALAGEADANSVPYVTEEMPLYQQNMEKGDFSIYSWKSLGGYDLFWTMNQDYNEDPEIGRLMRQKDFRRAWSLAMNRSDLNENLFLGVGVGQNAVPHFTTDYFPGEADQLLDTQFDLAEANSLLDGLGYTDTDGDGFRNRKGDLTADSGNLEVFLEVPTGGHAADRYVAPMRLVEEWLGEIGIKISWDLHERAHVCIRANECYLGFSGGWYSPNPFPYPEQAGVIVPVAGNSHIAVLISEYSQSNGASGMGPTGPDPAYQPLAPAGTYPSDVGGAMQKMIETYKDAASLHPLGSPDRNRLGKSFYSQVAQNKFTTGLIAFTGNQWGIMLKRNNFRNVPKHHAPATVGYRHEVYYFEDGLDNQTNPGNKSKRYSSESFLTGLSYN